jgi:hypothetical protein
MNNISKQFLNYIYSNPYSSKYQIKEHLHHIKYVLRPTPFWKNEVSSGNECENAGKEKSGGDQEAYLIKCFP